MSLGKIYKSENYVIIEESRGIFEFASARTYYNERINNEGVASFTLNESEDGRILIYNTDVIAGQWLEEDGITPFTLETLRIFLRTNTGNFSSASGGSDALLTHELYLTDAELTQPLIDAVLIPIPPIGQYFTDVTINMESTSGATPYDASTTHFVIHSPNGISPSFPIKQILETGFNNFYTQSIEPNVDQTPQSITANSGLFVSNLGNVPTIGRGNLRFKTTYRLKTLTV